MQDFQHFSVLDRHQMNVSKALLGLQREIDLSICDSDNMNVTSKCNTLNDAVRSMLNYDPTEDEKNANVTFSQSIFSIICERVKDILSANEKNLISKEETFSAISKLAESNLKIRSSIDSDKCLTSLDAQQSLKLLEQNLNIFSDSNSDDTNERFELLNNITSLISFEECSFDVLGQVAKAFNAIGVEQVADYLDFLCSIPARTGIFSHPMFNNFLELITLEIFKKGLSENYNTRQKCNSESQFAEGSLQFIESFGDVLVLIKDSLMSLKHGGHEEISRTESILGELFYQFFVKHAVSRDLEVTQNEILDFIKTSWSNIKPDKFPMMIHIPLSNSDDFNVYLFSNIIWDDSKLSDLDDRPSISFIDEHLAMDIANDKNTISNDHIPVYAMFADITKYFKIALQSDAPIDALVQNDFSELMKSPAFKLSGRTLINGDRILFFDISYLKKTFEFLKLSEYYNR